MIIIAGDSWGEGYYQMNPQGVKWPGFHHYWNNSDCLAINISYGGNSNHKSFSELELKLSKGFSVRPRVIVWLTCVLRDYPPGHSVDSIEKWTQRHYENIFDRAITLAHCYNCDIELLGGLGDIPRSFPEKLSSRVSIRCYSTIKFIDPDYSYEMPYGHITQVDRIPDENLKFKLIDYIVPKDKYLKTSNGHFPDNAHPGPDQYQKIYEFLK
jgi:hypothetical protein